MKIMVSLNIKEQHINTLKELFSKYKNPYELKQADIKDIEKIVKPLGSYKKKSQAVITIAKILNEEYNDEVPKNRQKLEQLPMVGRKTTNVILTEIYDIPNIAVDTHVSRISKRLGLAKYSDTPFEIETKLKRKIEKTKWNRFPQQAVLFGRYHCKAINPECKNCKLKNICKEVR